MTIRQFLLSMQHASVEHRADSAGALARAYLHGRLAPDAAWEAKTALLALLDDPAAPVRRALAEACAAADQAPRPLIVALASDQPDIASLVLARSPVLMDADLVDCVAVGCETTRAAVAGRGDLSKPVAAALAEVAGPPSLRVLAGNPDAAIGRAAMLRMVERHGGDGELRRRLLARPDLPIEARHAIVARMAEQLSAFGQERGWLNTERGTRVAREARDCAALALGDEAGETGLARLVAHLRAEGQLTAGLILRAILSLRLPFAETALAELSGLSRARVAGLVFEPYGTGFAALHHRAGLPPLLLPAIQAALCVWRDAAQGRAGAEGARLARAMIEAALTACETMPFAEARGLMALLARFEAEAARDEARLLAQAAQEQVAQEEARETVARLARELPGPVAGPPVVTIPDIVVPPAAPVAVPAGAWPAAPDPAERIGAIPAREEAVLDGLPEALLARFLAGRAAPGETAESPAITPVAAEAAPEAPAEIPTPVSVKASARPRAIAEALAASMIPEELVLSYRADRDRLRLAA